MRRALAALVVTAVAVVLLARFETRAPVTLNPRSALRTPAPSPPPAPRPGERTATGQALTTPFSVIQVQVTLTRGRITGVRTVELSGDGPHTESINRRAEPILRRAALRAGSPEIDVVSGATATSEQWIASLRSAVERAGG
jgi:uncharacterized protein with FMN-binding domain